MSSRFRPFCRHGAGVLLPVAGPACWGTVMRKDVASMYGCFDSVRARLAHGACVVSVARSGKGGKGPQRFSLVDFGSKALNVACGGTVVGLQAYRAAYEGYFWECVRLVLHSGAQNSLRTYVHTFHAPGSPPHQGEARLGLLS